MSSLLALVAPSFEGYMKKTQHWGHRLLTWGSNSFDKSISNQSITGEIAKVTSFMPRIN